MRAHHSKGSIATKFWPSFTDGLADALHLRFLTAMPGSFHLLFRDKVGQETRFTPGACVGRLERRCLPAADEENRHLSLQFPQPIREGRRRAVLRLRRARPAPRRDPAADVPSALSDRVLHGS
jgi:hypothetical protein